MASTYIVDRENVFKPKGSRTALCQDSSSLFNKKKACYVVVVVVVVNKKGRFGSYYVGLHVQLISLGLR